MKRASEVRKKLRKASKHKNTAGLRQKEGYRREL